YPKSRTRNFNAQKTTTMTASSAVMPIINNGINTDIATRSFSFGPRLDGRSVKRFKRPGSNRRVAHAANEKGFRQVNIPIAKRRPASKEAVTNAGAQDLAAAPLHSQLDKLTVRRCGLIGDQLRPLCSGQLIDQVGHETGPAGLVRGAAPTAIVA